MFSYLKDRVDYLFGRGKHSIFVPVMDGAFKPNEYLDSIKIIHKQEDIDNLILNKSDALFSANSTIFAISNEKKPKKHISFSNDINASAGNASG